MIDFGLVIYIRHKMTSTNEILDDMWKNGIIGIHYADIDNYNIEEYREEIPKESTLKTIQSNFKLMDLITEKGALVAADFRNIDNFDELKNKSLLLGVIEKGTKKDIKEYESPKGKNGYLIYKTLQMKKPPKIIYYQDYPILFSCQPQRSTICQWHLMKQKLPYIYQGKPLPNEVTSLDPSELEVICYEYLRKNILACLLLPIGRTLYDVDIVGIDKFSNKIFAQVTFSRSTDEIKSKAKQLLNARKNKESLLYFFAHENMRDAVEKIDKEIKFESIEDIFNTSEGDIRKSISIMLNK